MEIFPIRRRILLLFIEFSPVYGRGMTQLLAAWLCAEVPPDSEAFSGHEGGLGFELLTRSLPPSRIVYAVCPC